jgi:methyltransferase (TIGR00027 family)
MGLESARLIPQAPRVMEGIGATALMTAASRALETERGDGQALLSDELARELAGEKGFDLLARAARIGVPSSAGGSPVFVVRHRFLDDVLKDLTGSGIRQVVLVAGGLDTRAYRLPWPDDTRLFEIDQPHVLAYKDTVLASRGAQARCDRREVPADLRQDWPTALLERGFDPERPTAWVAEGILFYIPEPSVHGLLDEMRRLSAPGSHLLADVLGTDLPPEIRDMFARWDAPFLFLTDDPEELMRSHGWQSEVIAMDDVGRRLGIVFPPVGQVVLASC